MAIRTRILFVVLGLVFVALGVLDVVAYDVVRNSLLSTADTQLAAAEHSYFDLATGTGFQGAGRAGGTECFGLPFHSFGAAYRTSGGSNLVSIPCSSVSVPSLPASIASDAVAARGAPVYASVGSYQVLAEAVPHTAAITSTGSTVQNPVFVVGEPLAPLNSTLGRVLFFELLFTGSILIAAGAAAYFLVQLGLRPLEKMEETAGEIAAGDLSRRVEETDERTEVGRLGSSLNVMLSRIEDAFRAKEASEEQLRKFIADASHELRTPLTSIRGYAELFGNDRVSQPADLSAALKRIESESARMSGLVEDLLLLARLDQGRPFDRSPVDLHSIADDVAADARMLAPSRTVTVTGESSAPPDDAEFVALGDEERLRQVVTNLVANALAHTPDGSPIELVLTQGPEVVRLMVVDHGPGVAAEERGKVFDRFWRADEARQRSKGGAGLGLSIVSAVVGAHGGGVFVADTPGGGATFVVDLPRAAEQQAEDPDFTWQSGNGASVAPAWAPLPRSE